MDQTQPFLDSSDIVDDGPELARRMDRDGYLVVRGLLNPDRIFALRQTFLTIAYKAGWVSWEVSVISDQVPFSLGKKVNR